MKFLMFSALEEQSPELRGAPPPPPLSIYDSSLKFISIAPPPPFVVRIEALKKKRMERAALGEWASKEDGREDEGDEFSDDGDKEDFPHACFICRDGFTDPVVTLCG